MIMRQIKFRGKSLNDKKWVYGFYCRHDYGAQYQDKKLIKEACSVHDIWTADGWVAVDEASIGQFTGLTDRNGKGIYEGDILSFPYEGVADTEVIIFEDGCFQVDDGWEMTAICCLDTSARIIVGNVFDNPELIK